MVCIDVESVYFLLMEMVKKLGNSEECKDICLQICDILFASSFPTTLKAKLYFSIFVLPLSLSMILNAMPSFKACRVALLKKTISFAHESSMFLLLWMSDRISRVLLQIPHETE